ncbi:MFS transporter, partial [Planktotalea sp.]|uniref:MFS transporter n=1 Tax=Planktotalea sp. TaxID=2029877 RepID=UPI0032992979
MNAPDGLKMGRVEFIAFFAMIFATIAFSIDAMLPALPEIAQELSPSDPNRAQLILTSFVIGMGAGTFVAGPLSDSFGRKSIITLGAVLYCLGAFIAWSSSSLEVVLTARALQGLGAAGPRVVGLAVIRDLYEGRGMAKLMSFVMMVFTVMPAFAPLIGTTIIEFADWRAIFVAFMLFSLMTMLWMHLRLHETLPKSKRRPFEINSLTSAIVELLSHRTVRISIACQTLGFGMLFGMLSSVHQIYDITFGRAEAFPYWFAGIALFCASASFLNAMLVMRIGMRKMV